MVCGVSRHASYAWLLFGKTEARWRTVQSEAHHYDLGQKFGVPRQASYIFTASNVQRISQKIKLYSFAPKPQVSDTFALVCVRLTYPYIMYTCAVASVFVLLTLFSFLCTCSRTSALPVHPWTYWDTFLCLACFLSSFNQVPDSDSSLLSILTHIQDLSLYTRTPLCSASKRE